MNFKKYLIPAVLASIMTLSSCKDESKKDFAKEPSEVANISNPSSSESQLINVKGYDKNIAESYSKQTKFRWYYAISLIELEVPFSVADKYYSRYHPA